MACYVHSLARKWNLEAAEQMLKAVSAESGRPLRSETLKISLALSPTLFRVSRPAPCGMWITWRSGMHRRRCGSICPMDLWDTTMRVHQVS